RNLPMLPDPEISTAHSRLAKRSAPWLANVGLTISSDFTQEIMSARWRMYIESNENDAALPLAAGVTNNWLLTAAKFSRFTDTDWSVVSGQRREPLLASSTNCACRLIQTRSGLAGLTPARLKA